MNWKNLRFFDCNEKNSKRDKLILEVVIRHQYLIHCFTHNKEPSIERKLMY